MANIPTQKMIAKAIMVFGGAQVVTILAALVRSKVAAITIGATGVGLMALYTSITAFITQFANLGIQDSSVQVLSSIYGEGDEQKTRHMVATLRLWEVLTATAGMLIMLVLSPLLALIYFGSPSSHFHSLLLLSITPPALIITSLETSILKSLQQTRLLTLAITASALTSVVLSLPFYIFMRWDGIVFIVVLTSVVSAAITAFLGHRACNEGPDFGRLRELKSFWQESRKLIIMGAAFVITGLCSMGSDLLLQTYFNTISSMDIVGFYKVGYQLSILYPGMIFTAVNYDYFPRLSQISHDVASRNILMSRQIRVLLLIVAPCIALFIILMPWIVPLLLSDEFLDIVPMVRVGCLTTIVRCISLPICFLPMAMGKPKDFMKVELVSYAAIVLCVFFGVRWFGIIGIGYGFIMAYIIEMVFCWVLCHRKYGFRLMWA